MTALMSSDLTVSGIVTVEEGAVTSTSVLAGKVLVSTSDLAIFLDF